MSRNAEQLDLILTGQAARIPKHKLKSPLALKQIKTTSLQRGFHLETIKLQFPRTTSPP